MAAIQSLFSQLEEAVKTADLSLDARFKLSTQIKSLAHSIATPRQIIQHYAYMHTEQVVVKIVADLDIFQILTESKSSLTVEEIAAKTGADALLLERILKHLAATDTITEVGESTFAANHVTSLLASPAGKANLIVGYETLNNAYRELPKMLKDTQYKNPDQTTPTSFQRAYDTKLPFFVFLQQDAEKIRYFQEGLATFRSPNSWTDAIPLTEKLQGSDDKAPLFVDVGGGHGLQCAAFRKATQIPGRVICQDLPETVSSAPAHEGVEMMAQNFFEKNQIQGARNYYIRNCLHDVPDEPAKQILQHIKDAMTSQSLLLIDDRVLPEKGTSLTVMQLDITMMAMLNGTERTLTRWKKLLAEVGLEITQVYGYDGYGEYSVMEVAPIES